MSTTEYLTVPLLIRGRFRQAQDASSPRIYSGSTPSTTAAMREELLTSSRQPELMIRFLAEIDRKLDAVLTLIQSETLDSEFPFETHIVELSGAALSFEANQELQVGSYIEIVIMMEEYPLRIVSAIAQIDKKGPSCALPCMHPHQYSATFTTIEEEDREAVIRFVFSMDRKRIRQQKNENS